MSNWQVRYLGAVHKRLRQLGGGVKNPEKLPTSFMNGPLVRKQSRVNVFARESNMYSFALRRSSIMLKLKEK